MILLFNTNILLTAKCSISHFSQSYGRFKLTKSASYADLEANQARVAEVAEVRQLKTAVNWSKKEL